MPTNLPPDVTAEVLPDVGSTMDAARAYKGAGVHWVLAQNQTAARGTRGRSWLSAEGAFAGTLCLPVDTTPSLAALRSFVAATALFDTLSQYVTASSLGQKWPNDVLLQGGKVAGILLEAVGNGTHVDRLLIGIGVNLGNAPDNVPDAAFTPKGLADVADLKVTPEDFLPPLATALQSREAQFCTDGFAPIRKAWMKSATRLGQVITARTGRGDIHGIFDGIDNAGNLVLLTAKGQTAIPAADVYF